MGRGRENGGDFEKESLGGEAAAAASSRGWVGDADQYDAHGQKIRERRVLSLSLSSRFLVSQCAASQGNNGPCSPSRQLAQHSALASHERFCELDGRFRIISRHWFLCLNIHTRAR